MNKLDINNVSPEEWEELYSNHNGWDSAGSGTGSKLSNNISLINYLTEIIEKNDITSVLDVGCGDLQWLPYLLESVSKEVNYTGLDCSRYILSVNEEVHKNYTYIHKDIYNEEFRIDDTQYDLVICKDVVQHRANEDSILLNNLDKINTNLVIVIYPDWHQIDKNKWFHIYEYTHINSYIADENKNILMRRGYYGKD